MANEITEIGQFATYAGPQLTLAGSDLASKLTSLLAREGSGTARGWKLFDPTKSDFLNTKKILYPGDVVLVNAKSLPMDFPVPVAGSGGGSGGSISWPLFTEGSSGPYTELDGLVDVSQAYTPSFSFSTGGGNLQMQLNASGNWVAPSLITLGNTAQFRIQHSTPFSGTLTLTA